MSDYFCDCPTGVSPIQINKVQREDTKAQDLACVAARSRAPASQCSEVYPLLLLRPTWQTIGPTPISLHLLLRLIFTACLSLFSCKCRPYRRLRSEGRHTQTLPAVLLTSAALLLGCKFSVAWAGDRPACKGQAAMQGLPMTLGLRDQRCGAMEERRGHHRPVHNQEWIASFWLLVCTLPHDPLKLNNIEKGEYNITKGTNGHCKNCLISSPLRGNLCTYFDDIHYWRWKSDSSTGLQDRHFTDLCTGNSDVARWFIQVEICPCVPFFLQPTTEKSRQKQRQCPEFVSS